MAIRYHGLSGEAALAAVKQDSYALRHVREQSEGVCLAAVEQDGYALQYVLAPDVFCRVAAACGIETDQESLTSKGIEEMTALENFVTCARAGLLKGASSGERAARQLALAACEYYRSLDGRNRQGLLDYMALCDRSPMEADRMIRVLSELSNT